MYHAQPTSRPMKSAGGRHGPGVDVDPTVLELPDRYRPIAELGRGGMGVVYQAIDLAEERQVAVKVLSPRLASDLVALVRFNREARTTSSLRHPNICPVFEISEHRGSPFIVMELLDGETVKARLARGDWSTPLVLEIARQVAEGLGAAHANYVLHRDIKPANIFLTRDGTVKILDFGVAKHFAQVDASTTLTATDPRSMPGTVAYMSPEQLLGQRLDQRSDLFSLGVVVYEMLTGSTPFRGGSSTEMMAAILGRKPSPVPAMPYAMEWGHVLDRLLAKNPEHRYANAGALLDDLARLSRLVEGQPVSWPDALPSVTAVQPSLAVLPFEPRQGLEIAGEHLQDLDYYRYGLFDELIAGLMRAGGLRIVPRTLAVRPTEPDGGLAHIGRRLHADRILHGIVERHGDRLRATAMLFGVREDGPVWTRRYEVPPERLFSLRDDIVRDVLAEFRLDPDRTTQVNAGQVRSRHAFYHCLKGRFFWSKRYEGGLQHARQCFEEAIRLDPGLAIAHAGLADTYSFLGFYCLVRPRDAFAMARQSAEIALHLDSRLADAHVSRGLTRLGGDWRWEDAARSFERAIELDPAHGLARIYLSWVYVLLGRADEARGQAERAQDIDPMSPTLNAGTAYTFFLSRAYERAIRESEKALEIDRDFLVGLYVMALCKAQLGATLSAIGDLERAVSLSGGMPFYLGLLGKLYADTGQTSRATDILRRLDVLRERTYVPPHCCVYIHAGLGDLDQAFAWQDRAFEDGASPFNYFAPVLECLHDDPRFKEDIRAWGVEV
jgi:eukaryotic-like serine/threonine-protein kinase